eukprot:m.47003 g.47003  ORF g.47003 m.47003 type:complete len:239 (-) comp10436_c0_seq1:629-1345(-)
MAGILNIVSVIFFYIIAVDIENTESCSCQCSAFTSSGFNISCYNTPYSLVYELLLYKTLTSPRPFALYTSSTPHASFHGLLLPNHDYYARISTHNSSISVRDISHDWNEPCSPPIQCTTLSDNNRQKKLSNKKLRSHNMVSLEMFRMSETYMMKGENLAPPAAVVDFLPSHDSADLYGAAWLYTLSNGYPAGRDPVQPNKQTVLPDLLLSLQNLELLFPYTRSMHSISTHLKLPLQSM